MPYSTQQERALKLLGAGIEAAAVAKAVGVTESAVSQWLSDEEFSKQVQELRYTALAKHNERDASYDEIEDDLLNQLKQTVPLLMKPMEIARVLTVVNGAKRRGSSAPDSIVNQNLAVQLNMPTQIVQKFITNIDNIVVQAGEQSLVTMQAGVLLKQLKQKTIAEVNPNEPTEATELEGKVSI